MTVMDGKGPCFLARRFVLEDSLGESLATATPVGAALPDGGVVYPLYHYHPRVKARSTLDVRRWRHRHCYLPEGVAFGFRRGLDVSSVIVLRFLAPR